MIFLKRNSSLGSSVFFVVLASLSYSVQVFGDPTPSRALVILADAECPICERLAQLEQCTLEKIKAQMAQKEKDNRKNRVNNKNIETIWIYQTPNASKAFSPAEKIKIKNRHKLGKVLFAKDSQTLVTSLYTLSPPSRSLSPSLFLFDGPWTGSIDKKSLAWKQLGYSGCDQLQL